MRAVHALMRLDPFSSHPQGHVDQFPALSPLVSSKSILLDCSSSGGTTPLLKWWIENGGNVVLCNKKVPNVI